MSTKPFRPALIVVDFQEDFCPPNGALAVPSARSIAPHINTLLSLPFTLRIATKDWHPRTHISFTTQHPPDTSSILIANPANPSETQESRLWPPHCIQHTSGADFAAELEAEKLDAVVCKGVDERVETYSAFCAPFRRPKYAETELGGLLREKGVTHVYCVGLAWDYCVLCTARDAVEEGFETVVVEEGCKGTQGEGEGRARVEREYREAGVELVGIGGEEVRRVRELGGGE